jgi:hypothetical protein
MSSTHHIVQNFGRNVSFTPQKSYQPKSEADVLRILAEHRGSRIPLPQRLGIATVVCGIVSELERRRR